MLNIPIGYNHNIKENCDGKIRQWQFKKLSKRDTYKTALYIITHNKGKWNICKIEIPEWALVSSVMRN